MVDFASFAATRAPRTTVLFCATGPSLAEAHRFAHLGDVACIGEAGLLIPDRPLQWLFFNNWKRANASRQLFDRTKHIISPETIADDDVGAQHDVTKLDWLPQDKLIAYPRRKKLIYPDVKRMCAALRDNELVPFAFSVMALLALHLLGYRRILAFGNDGGHHHAPGVLGATDLTYSYDVRAAQVKKMAKVIEQETETRVFFFPDIPESIQ